MHILSVGAWSSNFFWPITAILCFFFLKNPICVQIKFGTIRKISLSSMHWNVWEIDKLRCCFMLAGPNMNILSVRAWSCNLCGLKTIILRIFLNSICVQIQFGTIRKISLGRMHQNTEVTVNLRSYIVTVGTEGDTWISYRSELGRAILWTVLLGNLFTLLWPQ